MVQPWFGRVPVDITLVIYEQKHDVNKTNLDLSLVYIKWQVGHDDLLSTGSWRRHSCSGRGADAPSTNRWCLCSSSSFTKQLLTSTTTSLRVATRTLGFDDLLGRSTTFVLEMARQRKVHETLY